MEYDVPRSLDVPDRLGVPVLPVESQGWNGDFIEAECFGFLAVRSRRSLPLSLPTTTGAPTPLTGGEWNEPRWS